MEIAEVPGEVREDRCAHYGEMARSGGPCTQMYDVTLCPGCEYRGKWVTATTVQLGELNGADIIRK